MVITSLSALLIISPLFFAGFIQGDVTESFTDDVKNELPESVFSKLFKVKSDSVDEVSQALKDAVNAFCTVLNTDVPDDLNQKFSDRAKKFINLTPEQLLKVNAKAVSGTLADQGVLNADNEQNLADSYVNDMIDAANGLEDDKISHTFPALAKANANALKSNGLSGFQLVVRNFFNTLLGQLDMMEN